MASQKSVRQTTSALILISSNLKQKFGRVESTPGVYRDRRQDVTLEMERNEAAPKQSQVWQSNQLLLSFPLFPV